MVDGANKGPTTYEEKAIASEALRNAPIKFLLRSPHAVRALMLLCGFPLTLVTAEYWGSGAQSEMGRDLLNTPEHLATMRCIASSS